jgi:hypothetical protein
MNHLESLKSKLRPKPAIDEKITKKIKVKVPIISQPQKIEIYNEITDVRDANADFDILELTARLKQNKLSKVKEVAEETEKLPVLEEEVLVIKKKAKKLKSRPVLKIIEEGETEGNLEPIEAIDLDNPEDKLEEVEVNLEEPRKRKTPKPIKGVAILSPEDWVEINGENVIERLPEKKPVVNYKVSSYYMNNREIFINFINSLFAPYRDAVMDESDPVTCDTIGNVNEDFSLLTHQKIVRDYLNLYTPYRGLLLFHGLGSGKCHAKGTPIMLSDGSIKLVENIVVGDFLMGDDSTPRKVLSLAKGQDKMYNIIPTKGNKYTVNQEHILCLKASGFPKFSANKHKHNTNYNVQWIEKNDFCSKTFTYNPLDKENQNFMKSKADEFFKEIKTNYKTSDNTIEISVKDYLKLSNKKKAFLKGYKVPVQFPEKELPIDPYLIGYWLGDGSSYGAQITSQDSRVLQYFSKKLPEYGLGMRFKSNYDYNIIGNGRPNNNIFLNTLKNLDLIKNKHIPMIYKCNSRENRLKLLAGLIDSDGHLNKKGSGFEFCQKNEKLMDDVIYLANSLGFSCYKIEKKTSWKYKGVQKYGTCFRCNINGEGIEQIPTLISRKKAEPRKQIKDVLVSGIKVEYLKEDDYYGFTLDGNNRYLMGDFTVTHNTLSSIAIAEGMKSAKKVFILTPASLKRNYIEELKKGGDPLYKKNQYWEWISTVSNPEVVNTLSSVLNLSIEFINKKKGAWLVNTKESESNYDGLSSQQKASLNQQLEEMIESKYHFIKYNGLRREKFRLMTDNFERNIFDDSVVIIDEAHNFVSRIVNKLKQEKEIRTDDRGRRITVSIFLSLILYEMLLTAQNCKIVLLSGTPMINYPNEIGIMFNILRGYIKTWELPLDIKTSKRINQEEIERIFATEKLHDYIEYSASSKKLLITRNPFGFESKIKKESGYHGVTNKEGERKDSTTGKVVFYERGQESDADFEKKIIRILRDSGIEVINSSIKIHMYKALPDNLDDFLTLFVDVDKGTIKNSDLFKRRIMGLTSYFRSAQEELLPRYDKLTDFKVIKVPMSDYQFVVYELARAAERKQEDNKKKKRGIVDENGIYKEPASTYRIFSRLYCNFVMPRPPGRPVPTKRGQENEEFICPKEEDIPDDDGLALDQFYAQEQAKAISEKLEKTIEDANAVPVEKESRDLSEEEDIEKDGDDILEKIGDKDYPIRIQAALDCLKKNASKYLSKSALEKYSPKYLNILENIEDPEHLGNHLVYSYFRTLEGIGVFTLVLDYNGFTQFKIKKGPNGDWELDISPENRGKPTYALYTGKETAEEKEIVRNVYNGDWPEGSKLTEQLKEIANNNNMGEIIKVFMITASGSEGINLRNTRYVHIMEPYWNPARIDQVVGRARRICSHKALPEALQTVEVFLYLMTFSPAQIDSDGAIELKLKDKSKKKYPVKIGSSKMSEIPFTSDEALYEISNIKEEVSEKLITSIKESSIDCAIYSKLGSKEKLHCLAFPDANSSKFSYVPSINKEQSDTVKAANKTVIEWTGYELKLKQKLVIARKISNDKIYIYDVDSYKQALVDPQVDPVLLGVIETDKNGVKKFKKI